MLGTINCGVGFVRVRKHIRQAGKKGNTLDQKPLTELMTQCISDCGNLQMHDNLSFIVNKALLDVRCILIDFVSEMTFDLIHLGWGSKQGLDCIQLLRAGKVMERFQMFHERFLE